jgi:Fe-S-cluster containining protein
MRECNGCTACCTWLIGDSYGWAFGRGNSCRFLCESGCSVHKVRPKTCESYFCAWSQELINEEYRPDQCGFLVSVENNQDGQYLKVIETKEGSINKDIIEYFDNWGIKMNTPVMFIKQQEK